MVDTIGSVKFVFEGFHNWPAAPIHRLYLRKRHRHLFHVDVQVELHHDNRDIEFHDLLDFCKSNVERENGSMSCEAIGKKLIATLSQRFPGRWLNVSIFEDGEVGAISTHSPLNQP